MLTITVDAGGALGDLARLYQRLGDLTPALDSIGMELEGRISGRFETRTDPNGASWAPWAPMTVKYYPEDGNRKLLDRYGDMLRGLSHEADSTSVRVGFDKLYATFHEWGTKYMPRRGLLYADPDAGTLAPDDEAAVLDIIGLYLMS